MMFYCIPQQAYMSVSTCKSLRTRPVGKAPAGSQPMLRACERCSMHVLVDAKKVPTISLESYLDGTKPKTANLNSSVNKKLMRTKVA